MKATEYKILSQNKIGKNTYELILEGDTTSLSRPGQFVNIEIPGLFLRRPISVCDYTGSRLILIYKAVGEGTRILSCMKPGEHLDVLCGLGNGYDMDKSGLKPLLIGGGAGIPPLFNLCRRLISEGKQVRVILGFNVSSEIFYDERFRDLGAEVYVCTADGSEGIRGFVTDAYDQVSDSTFYYTCGPLPMLKAVYRTFDMDGQFSFEERMGCGFGACMGCTHKTKSGNFRICKDGPVIDKEEIIW
jgi:dihydroorotate dehydrogenase electron transfer subunit